AAITQAPIPPVNQLTTTRRSAEVANELPARAPNASGAGQNEPVLPRGGGAERSSGGRRRGVVARRPPAGFASVIVTGVWTWRASARGSGASREAPRGRGFATARTV